MDALDARSVNRHADAVAAKAGPIDVALNAVGILHVQGTPFTELSFADYAWPIAAYTQTNFITAKAVARHMVKQGSGVILNLSTPGSRMATACASPLYETPKGTSSSSSNRGDGQPRAAEKGAQA